MDRLQLLEKIIYENKVENYLEIGTFQGDSFLPLKCKNKIAVDPEFRISRKKKLIWLMKNRYNKNNIYFEMTSDSFFEQKKDLLKGRKLNLIFIDGLHTFRASLNDVLNSIKFLDSKGYIVMHDCFPPHKAAATPAGSAYEARIINNNNNWPGDWCGDVWKTIVYLKEAYKHKLKISVLNADFGLGVIQVQNNNLNLDFDPKLFASVNALDYTTLLKNPEEMINLRHLDQVNDLP